MTTTAGAVKFAGILVGIYFFYGWYGVFKEKLTKREYDGEKFEFTNVLVLMECVCNVVVALFLTWVTGGRVRNSGTPQKWFVLLAVSYLSAMVASTLALRDVSYPTQVLAKSCKAVPIMILDFVLGREKYSLKKWAAVVAIVAGVCAFTLGSSNKSGKSNQMIGLALVFLSLCLDGVTGSTQTKLKNTTKPSSHQFMLFMNLYACLLVAPLVVLSGEGAKVGRFVDKHQDAAVNMVLYALSAACGQVFIFLALTEYGPVRLALITTTRKFFTLLVSFLYFGHAVTAPVVAGVALVFCGIALDKSSDGKGEKAGKKAKKKKA